MMLFKLFSLRFAEIIFVFPFFGAAQFFGLLTALLQEVAAIVDALLIKVFTANPKPGEVCEDCGEVHDSLPTDDDPPGPQVSNNVARF